MKAPVSKISLVFAGWNSCVQSNRIYRTNPVLDAGTNCSGSELSGKVLHRAALRLFIHKKLIGVRVSAKVFPIRGTGHGDRKRCIQAGNFLLSQID